MSKSKTGAKVAIGILAAALLIGGLGAATRGFRNWDPQTWFDNWGKGDESSSEDTVEEGENLQLRVFGGPKFAATAQVGSEKKVVATIKNESTDPRIRWESSDPTKVKVLKEYTVSGEENTITLASLFAGEVTVKAYPALQQEDGAEVTCTFANEITTKEAVGIIAMTDKSVISGSGTVVQGYTAFATHLKEQMPGVFDWAVGEEDELSLNGGVASKTSWGDSSHYYKVDLDSQSYPAFSAPSDRNHLAFAVYAGTGVEGAEALPADLDAGEVKAEFAQEQPIPNHIFVQGNNYIALVPLLFTDLTGFPPAVGQFNEYYSFGGLEEDKIYVDEFVEATGVEVDSPTVVFNQK